MKVLYAIQGTGNGHISRAKEVIPFLRKMADVDIFLSGNNSSIQLPYEIKYKSKGLSFEYDNSGGLNYFKTIQNLEPRRIRKEVRDFPVEDYDLVISDFECISSYAARKKGIPSMAFSHQVSLLSEFTPKPSGMNLIGELVLEYYAPTNYAVGLHFKEYDDYIFTPIIRQEIRQLNPLQLEHYTVYLPAFGDREIINILSQLPNVRWEVFSREAKTNKIERNVLIRPIQNDKFIRSLETCSGIITSAGFETPAEALFLNKKLFVVPIKGQYEQLCNAAALSEIGVPYSTSLNSNLVGMLDKWTRESQHIPVHYPNITEILIERMLFEQEFFFLPTLAVG